VSGATAVAALLCGICALAGFIVLHDGIKDRRRFRPGAKGWIFAGSYMLVLPCLILLALALSGCGMLLTLNPIGMLGIVHHHSHATAAPVCPPKDKHCIDDSGMRP
jgi:hypothetical protein